MYKVFLVDDEEIMLTQTAETVPWLENGFVVAGMESNPVCAVGRILKEKPEVVICDLRMPQMDGHELMRRVQEGGLHPEFVMLSAYGNFKDSRTFFRQEGFDYLLKPLQMQEMEILLENLNRRLEEKNIESDEGDDEDVELSAKESFQVLVEHIRKNYAHNYTLEQLGKSFGLSNSYICRQFSRQYHTSLTGFVTKLRMAEAAKRILEGKENLKGIALACGYKDYYYFSKVFKGYYGVSPTQYKEKVQKEEKVQEEDGAKEKKRKKN